MKEARLRDDMADHLAELSMAAEIAAEKEGGKLEWSYSEGHPWDWSMEEVDAFPMCFPISTDQDVQDMFGDFEERWHNCLEVGYDATDILCWAQRAGEAINFKGLYDVFGFHEPSPDEVDEFLAGIKGNTG